VRHRRHHDDVGAAVARRQQAGAHRAVQRAAIVSGRAAGGNDLRSSSGANEIGIGSAMLCWLLAWRRRSRQPCK
jgi:hypothetical protein